MKSHVPPPLQRVYSIILLSLLLVGSTSIEPRQLRQTVSSDQLPVNSDQLPANSDQLPVASIEQAATHNQLPTVDTKRTTINYDSILQEYKSARRKHLLALAEIQVDLAKQSVNVNPISLSKNFSNEPPETLQATLTASVSGDNLIRLQTSNFQFDAQNKIFSFDAVLINISQSKIFVPLRAIIDNLRPGPPTISVVNADAGGNGNGALWDYSNYVGSDVELSPNETSRAKNWKFFNPQIQQFSFTVKIEGELTGPNPPVPPTVTQPVSPTNQLQVTLTGMTAPQAAIEVIGGSTIATARADGLGAFSVNVPLLANRPNRLFVTAINSIGRSAATPVEVIHDAQPPFLFVDVPLDSSELTNETITVIGRVGDALTGFMGLRVTVNGLPANVIVGIGTNGTFERPAMPLALGSNTITVTATDQVGNSVTKTITATRVDVTGQPLLTIVSGNNQQARINTQLPQPIVVKMTKPDNTPFANKIINVDVTRSDGRLSITSPVGNGALMVQARTNAAGLATVYWKLGSDAGCGNNRVSVTSTSIAGTILFCASAMPNPATRINVGMGNNQRTEINSSAPESLRVWVNDGVNGAANVPVTFTVTQGGGRVNGANTAIVKSSLTGHAEVNFTLGPDPGNNVIEAAFPGNTGLPATFTIFGLARVTGTPTSFTGLVLDNANNPIQGATCRLLIRGTTLRTTFSDAAGNFTFANVPSGPAHLSVNGLTATAVNGDSIPPGSFPSLGYEFVIVPNTENSLSTPVLLPPLNPNNARVYRKGSAGDIELTVEGIEGLKMIVKAGSLRLFDGTEPDSAIISLNQVHFDKIPMPIPDGAAPPMAWTLQPSGATFTTPVQITMPNMTGLPGGATMYFFSFNHDNNRFEIVSSGKVSADGLTMVTDPGSGISIAGWGGICPPYPEQGESKNNNDEETCDLPPPSPDAPAPPTDPVYLFSGEFHMSFEDLRIKGRGMDFVWNRTYRSKIGPNTPQGNGWDFSYNIFLQQEGDALRFCNGNSRNDLYLPETDNTWARGEFFQEFTQNLDGTYTQTSPDRTQISFNPFDGSVAQGKIAAMVDRNGNQMRFSYNAQGRLERITDTLDRDILIGYNAAGLISTITDFAGRVVRYEYYNQNEVGGNVGDLKSVITPAVTGTPNNNNFPNGKTTTYTYSKGFANARLNNNLLAITDGRGNQYLRNIYASTTDSTNINFDRVARQIWGGDTVDVAYIPQTPSARTGKAALKVILNDRVGNVKEYFYDIRNREILRREYTGRANSQQPTTETANRPTGKLRSTDPDFFETRFEYSYDSQLLRTIHPNGNITENVYERDLNPNASPRSRGNLRKVRRLPGTHTPVGDQAVIEESFVYDTDFAGGCACGFNFVTQQTDGRGNVTMYEYDAAGNRVRATHRIPSIVEDFEYNPFGQMAARTWPDNGSGNRRRDVYAYYDSGLQRGYLQQEILDQPNFALTTTYEYDRVGNVIRMIDPRGHDTQYVVNALDQTVREISREVRDGSGIRYQRDTFYDANNNVTRLDVQNIDENGRQQANTHFTTIYEYEILNNLIRVREEVNTPEFIVTEYAYDNNRNRTLVRYGEATAGRQLTNVMRTLYDERDLVFREIRALGDPQQSTTQSDYDRNGNLVALRIGIENAPRISSFVYDSYNRLVTSTDPMGNLFTFNYDANSNRVRSRFNGELADTLNSANNVRLSDLAFVYDAMDRVTRTETEFFDTDTQAPIDDGKATTQLFYSDNSQLTRVVDDNNHAALLAYDTANRMKTLTDPKNNTATFAYDANSNVITLTEVEKSDLGNPDETFITTNVYDNLDRLIKTTDNVDNINEYAYDSRSNRTLHSDALRPSPTTAGNRIRMSYDGLNRLIRTARYLTSDGVGGSAVIDSILTLQGWDHTSRLTSQTDDNNNTTAYSYDALNRQAVTTYADGTTQRATYDVHDNPITIADANGNVSTNTFDLRDRLIAKTIARGANIGGTTFENFKYDGRSRLVRAGDDDSEVVRGYNSLSQVTRETLNSDTTTSIYDGVGNMLSCTYPGGRRIVTSYDELDRKNHIVDQFGPIAEYKYIGPNRVERRDYANNTRCTYQYDGVKRMTRSTHVFDPANTARVFDDRSYTWDAMYNKTSRRDLLSNGLAHNYTYDSIYRLMRSIKTPTSGSSVTINYGFDGVGNRTTVTGGADDGNYFMNATRPEPADFQMNQYTTTPFDARSNDTNGNLSRINNSQPTQRSFTFDYRDHMIAHTDAATGVTSTYAYDALGRRIAKTVNNATTRFFYNGWQEIEEQNANGVTQATYVYGLYIDEALNMDRNGSDFFFHTDELYNVMKVTAANGSVAESYEYEDYGRPTIFNASGNSIAQSAIGNPLLFTGRRWDDETKFYYYRTRYLDSRAGRFISRDVIGAWGDLSNFGNGYAYVGNNSINLTDAMGLQATQERNPSDRPYWPSDRPWWEEPSEDEMKEAIKKALEDFAEKHPELKPLKEKYYDKWKDRYDKVNKVKDCAEKANKLRQAIKMAGICFDRTQEQVRNRINYDEPEKSRPYTGIGDPLKGAISEVTQVAAKALSTCTGWPVDEILDAYKTPPPEEWSWFRRKIEEILEKYPGPPPKQLPGGDYTPRRPNQP